MRTSRSLSARTLRAAGAVVATAAVAVSGAVLTAPASALEVEPGGVLAFDLGCATSPVADGYLQVAENTLYDPDLGYGLSQPVVCRDRGAPDDVRRDFVLTNGYTFRVDLPDGEYHVRIISGDEIASNNTGVSVQGVDQGSLQPRGTGEFASHDVVTEVTGGALEIEFRNDGRANGVLVSQVFAPTGLSATDVALTPPAVSLAWDAMPGAAEYTVYRSAAGADDFEALGSTSSTSFVDDGPELAYTYDYAVTQTSDAGIESALSQAVSVAVVDPDVEAPAAPTGVRLGKANQHSTTIGWDAVGGAVEYHVYRAVSPTSDPERIAVTDAPSLTVPGVAPINHYYTVLAVNTGGVSEPSEALLTPVTTRPIPPAVVVDECGQGKTDAKVLRNGDRWRAQNGGTNVYLGYSMAEAMQAAVDSLTPGRTEQERVVVIGSGTMAADQAVDLPSHTSFETCGVIDVVGNEGAFSYEERIGTVRVRHAEDVSVPFLNLTGNPNFGVYVRTSSDLHLGQLDLRMRGGHGVRIDSRDDDSVREARNIRIDDVYVSGTETHGVETYGVDGLVIGTVTAVDTGHAGLLLNDTVNADIGTVIGDGAAAGTGYATFRTANRNGMIDGAWPTNIRVGEIIAEGGGRGIFCVSESGGLEVGKVTIRGSGSNAVLIENCHNIQLATEGGLVEGPGDIRISARNEFANTSDITFSNFTLRGTHLNESPCGINTVVENVTLEDGAQINTCS